MKYMGSKARIAKEILPIILKDRTEGQWYVEPFVGGANLIDKVRGNRLGSDSNEYLIALLDAASKGWLPPVKFSEDEYKRVRDDKNNDPVMTGYAGFALSYGGKFFGGWCRDGAGKRNYVDESYRNALKQFPLLHGVQFVQSSYENLQIPPHSIVYCDPPYAGTTKYKDEFDNEKFWGWCKNLSEQGHRVFVSEYNAPPEWIPVWQKEQVSSLTKDTGSKKAVEKLFVYKAKQL